MAKHETIQVSCDRCGKVWNRSPLDPPSVGEECEFRASFGKLVAHLSDLCDRCHSIVQRNLELIVKKGKDE